MPLKFHRNEKKIHLQNIIISFLIKRILHRFKNYYKGDTSERLKRSTFANENQNEKSKRITGKHNFVLKIFILFFFVNLLNSYRQFNLTFELFCFGLFSSESYISMIRWFLKFEKKYGRIIVDMSDCPFQFYTSGFFKNMKSSFIDWKESEIET